MRVEELDLRELFEFSPQGGIHRFAGQRALIMDTVALGLLRKELIDTIGLTAARGVLTRFGYAHGWRTAQTLRHTIPWDSEEEWRKAGGRLHSLQGVVSVEITADAQASTNSVALWRDSYEAEQHLLHLGRSETPVCWTLAGYVSGHVSFVSGSELFCVEEQCMGQGDGFCRISVQPRTGLGERQAEILALYQQDLDAALRTVTQALQRTESQLRKRQGSLRSLQAGQAGAALDTRSPNMRRTLELATRVARVDSTVLLLGESGVGKERIARLIHTQSPRARGPFIAINCGAMPETLLESELFGHVRGSFTGAVADRVGLFEAANGGTLLLDEVGELSAAMQVKLLRVLQEQEIRRVGENQVRPVHARVLAATHRDLAAEVASGRFRQDLYYRMRVVELRVPPLRERREDVLPLARELLEELGVRMGRRVTGFTPEAAQQLLRYPWPGNVRELENAIERALALTQRSRIDLEDLPEELRAGHTVTVFPGQVRPLEDIEREYILAALRSNGGNRTHTAAQLRISSATLFRKLKSYGPGVPPPPTGSPVEPPTSASSGRAK